VIISFAADCGGRMKQKNLIGILLIAVFVVVTGIIFGTGQERGESSRMLESAAITDTQDTGETEKQKETETETETKASEQASQIYVYVCGHVKEPGVVRITSGQRVYEAIDAAGGMTEDAYPDALNLASPVNDGEKIYVPGQDEASKYDAGSETVSGGDGADGSAALVNINSASKEELMTLPGIGEAKADAIISYRETNGPFSSTDDILNVSGIKEGVYDQIKSLICV